MDIRDVQSIYENDSMMSHIDRDRNLAGAIQYRFVNYEETNNVAKAEFGNGLNLRITPIIQENNEEAQLYKASVYSSKFGYVEINSMDVGPHNIDKFSTFIINMSSYEKAYEISSKFKNVEEMNSRVSQLSPFVFGKMALEADEVFIGEDMVRVMFNNGYGVEILSGPVSEVTGGQSYAIYTIYNDDGIKRYIDNMECHFCLGENKNDPEDIRKIVQEYHMSKYLVAISELEKGELEINNRNCDLSKFSFLATHMANSGEYVDFYCNSCADVNKPHYNWDLVLKYTPTEEGTILAAVSKRDGTSIDVGEKEYTMKTENLSFYFDSLNEVVNDSLKLSKMQIFEIDEMIKNVDNNQNPIRDFLERDVSQSLSTNSDLGDILKEIGYSKIDMSSVFKDFSKNEDIVSFYFSKTEEGNRAGIFHFENGNVLMVEALKNQDISYIQPNDDIYRATVFVEYNGGFHAIESKTFSSENIATKNGFYEFSKLVAGNEYNKKLDEKIEKIEQIHKDYNKIGNIQELVTINSENSFVDSFSVKFDNGVYAEISKSSNDAGIEKYHINPFYKDESGEVFFIRNLEHDFVVDSNLSQIQMTQYLGALGDSNIDFKFIDNNNVELINPAFTEKYMVACIDSLSSNDSNIRVFGELLCDNSFGVECSTFYDGKYVPLGSFTENFSCESMTDFFEKSERFLESIERVMSVEKDDVIEMAKEALEDPYKNVISNFLHETEVDAGLEY